MNIGSSFSNRPAELTNSLQPSSSLTNSLRSDPTAMRDAFDATNAEEQSEQSELKEAFTDFVGQTLFGSMLASMRKTVGKPAYMHGGRTEEVFQQQLDQRIVEELTEASADTIADPMFDLFNLHRTSG